MLHDNLMSLNPFGYIFKKTYIEVIIIERNNSKKLKDLAYSNFNSFKDYYYYHHYFL